ncbi:hypothetical protein [Roseateles puraquae]|uniref:Uncharacterized protein n=1 Tax=Roseateles puraquae TaxID=431059 RepID=A0A254NLI1_9BURK|nr:hypothetical protein [Roseateles puraquae]MDG0853577.1 hypothetical protein [Roseateles puraquae]OWR05748.1 hypothetical protein CDO81_04675 [Roseateles puraquae]
MDQLANQTTPTSLPDDGILARVPSQFVGQAQGSLPEAELVPHDEIRIEVDAGWLGRVRLTFRKYRYTRPKGMRSAAAWSCRHAEPVVQVVEGCPTEPVGRAD